MQQKKLIAGALGCILVCSQPAGTVASAAAIPQIQDIGYSDVSNLDVGHFGTGHSDPLETDVPVSQEMGSPALPETDAPVSQEMGSPALPETDVPVSQEMGSPALPETDVPVLPEDLAPDDNDPDYVKRLMQQESREAAEPFSLHSVEAKTTKSPFTGLTYTHAAQLSDCNIVNGIDVSKWQADIDWEKVKQAGVKFVFIRCGYTALSKQFAMYEDEYFKKNIQEAYDAGIPVGIYFFSNSMTVSEAKKEAQKTLELIEDYQNMITMPVVYDFEAFSTAYRAYGLSQAQVTKNMLAYADIIQEAGFTPMYYGSPNFLDAYFDVSQLTNYDCWLANYTTKTIYTGDYTYWQYSSTGQVDGIAGNVDCNFYYTGKQEGNTGTEIDPEDLAEGLGSVSGLAMEDHETDSITIQWEPLEGAYGYKVYRSKSYGGTYKQLKTINENEVTSYTDITVQESEGRQYFYKVIPYLLDEDGNLKYGQESEILAAHTKRVHAFRLKTTTNVYLREQAGTEYPALAVVPAGTGLPFYKFTLSTEYKKWYKVTYKANGTSYTGYLSGSYADIYTYGKPTKNVNVRSGAGLDYKIQRTVQKGVKVTVVGNKTVSGTKWSHIKYTQNGKNYAGYIPAKYIKQI